jgi:hypothetical protein
MQKAELDLHLPLPSFSAYCILSTAYILCSADEVEVQMAPNVGGGNFPQFGSGARRI